MAINKKILEKIAKKTKSDDAIKKDLEKALSYIEEGRQGKRVVEKIIKSI